MAPNRFQNNLAANAFSTPLPPKRCGTDAQAIRDHLRANPTQIGCQLDLDDFEGCVRKASD